MCKAIEDMKKHAAEKATVVIAYKAATDFGKTEEEAVSYASEVSGKTPEEVKAALALL